jgi:hypothetical protein
MSNSIQNWENKTFSTETPARKSIYLFTIFVGFLCLALSAQFMYSDDDLEILEDVLVKQRSNPELTTVDRKILWEKKASKIRERKEINVLIGQVEGIQPIAPKKQAPDLRGTRAGTGKF